MQPSNFTVEHVLFGNILEGRILHFNRRFPRVPVEECRHSLAADGIVRTEGLIRPAGCNTLLLEPDDFLVEGVAFLHIGKGGFLRQLYLGRAGHTIEERRNSLTFDAFVRAERAIDPAGCDVLPGKPGNLAVEHIAFVHIRERLSGLCRFTRLRFGRLTGLRLGRLRRFRCGGRRGRVS